MEKNGHIDICGIKMVQNLGRCNTCMYTIDGYNRMRNVKDSKNEDARVAMCYGYVYGNLCQNGGSYSEIWNVIKKLSE